eukprot:401956-Amphidinium_carterae.1
MDCRREQLLEAVRDGCDLRHVPERYRADREVVLAAVQKDWHALEDAAEECMADSAIVLAA